MHDFGRKFKAVSRRVSHLRTRIEESDRSEKSLSYDKAEAKALEELLKVAAVYNAARGEGSHLENTLCLVHNVLGETLSTNSVNLDSSTATKLEHAWAQLGESISLIRKMADEPEEDI